MPWMARRCGAHHSCPCPPDGVLVRGLIGADGRVSRRLKRLGARDVRPPPLGLAYCGTQGRLGHVLGPQPKSVPVLGSHKWAALLRHTATHRLPLKRSTFVRSDHQAKGRIDPAISPGRLKRSGARDGSSPAPVPLKGRHWCATGAPPRTDQAEAGSQVLAWLPGAASSGRGVRAPVAINY